MPSLEDRASKHVGFDRAMLKRFRQLLGREGVNEHRVQEFLEKNTELLPKPYLQNHGLHGNFVISKFPLDTSLKTDFVYLSKSSDYWHVVLVELEHPAKVLFSRDRNRVHQTAEFQKALDQVQSWGEFARRHRVEVLRRLAPLRRPMTANDCIFKSVLVIGRSTEPWEARFADRLQSIAESGVKVYTYDSLVRGYQYQRLRCNVLSLSGTRYRYKHLNAQDLGHMLAYCGPKEIEFSAAQIATLEQEGYDMGAWVNGELLVVNGKDPASSLRERGRRTIDAG